MMRISGLVVMMCVAVCLQGDVSSSTTTKKSTEEKIWDTDTVLGQVLDELRFLRDEDQKNKEEIKKNKDEIHSLNEKYMAEIITLKDEDQKNKEENKINKEEIHSLKDADEKKTDEINNLKEMKKQFLNEINTLKDADEKKTDEINNLKEMNEQFLNEINTLKVEDKKNKDKIDNLTGQITNSQAAGASAAFTAVMNVEFFYPDAGDVIPFNSVWLNLGQHYNDQTSVFTCAENGLYLFSVTLYSGGIISGGRNRMSGSLMLDGVLVAEVYTRNEDPDYYQFPQSGVTAVVECPKGGSVWVECQYDGSQVYGSDTLPGSVFTGFAITYNIHP